MESTCNFKTPTALQWNAGIQQSISPTMVVSVSYVGTTGKHTMVTPDLNQPTPGPGAIAPRRPYPAFGSVSIFEAEGSSIYHSLQVTAAKRLSSRLNFQASYTWSHAIDNGDFQTAPQDAPIWRQSAATAWRISVSAWERRGRMSCHSWLTTGFWEDGS